MEIRLEGLCKYYPPVSKNGKIVAAVESFGFTVPDGKLVALLGPSGCGKSTTLNMISGLAAPSKGKIFFGDTDVTEMPPEERGVGMVFQNYALYPHLTVLQNISFPLENFKGREKLSREEIKNRAVKAAQLVQIEKMLDRKPSGLSGGQQQRVAIARALVKMPKVLLLDEPLSNLDARLRLQTREEIRRIQKETGITTLFVTHDQDEAMSVSDLIVVMKEGIIQQTGEPQAVYDDPANLFVAQFLGTPPINVFSGRVEGGKVFIGNDAVLDDILLPDGEVTVGIRPEGFIPDPDGKFSCKLERVSVMGRDVSIIASNENSRSGAVRAIVDPEDAENLGETVRFSLKPKKAFVFDPVTGERKR